LRQKALNSSQKGAQGKGEKVGKGKDKKSGEQGLETPRKTFGRPDDPSLFAFHLCA